MVYKDYSFHNSQGSIIIPQGSSRLRNGAAALDVTVPIYSGGLVVASTRKAQLKFRIAQHKLNSSIRKTTSNVRNNYRNILSNIKKTHYEQDAIVSAQSSLTGLKERYLAGSSNLTDVLQQQTKLLEAQMQYESARYDYIINLLRLKKEMGTLSVDDLLIVNKWLHKNRSSPD